MAKKLSQVVAVEKTTKSRVYSAVTDLHKKAQKAELYTGVHKEYAPLKDGGETLPPETKKVQLRSSEVLRQAQNLLGEHWDLEAAKDMANRHAVADVQIGGRLLLSGAPVTFLLFLEKQLADLRTLVDNMPVLPEDKDWTFDDVQGLYRTPVRQTHRTTKEQTPIVLYDATDKHPAQTQLITKDILVGYWSQTEFSGALKRAEKEEILRRLNTFSDAVKEARHAANQVAADEVPVAQGILNYIFGR